MFTQDWDLCIGRAVMLIKYLDYNLPYTMGRLKKFVVSLACFSFCSLSVLQIML